MSTQTIESGADQRAAQRRQTGSFFLMIGIVMAVLFWVMPGILILPFLVFFVIGRDENLVRFFAYSQAIIAIPFLLAAATYSMRPIRSIVRSPITWLVVTALVLAVAWPAFGLDSTRPLRAMPEAAIAHPGSTLLSAWGDEGLAVGDGQEHASLHWRYHTDGRYGDVLDFYQRELRQRGWSAQVYAVYGAGRDAERGYRWRRDDGYSWQVILPKDLTGSGDYKVIFYGNR